MKKFFRFSVFFIVFIVILIYMGGVYIFSQYYEPGTYINDVNMGMTKKTDLHESYLKRAKNYEIEIIEKEKTEVLKAKDFDYNNTLDEGESLYQNPFYWILTFLVPKHYELNHCVDYDKSKLNAAIDNLEIIKNPVIEPVDAKISFNGDKFVVEKEIEGNKINCEKFYNGIFEAVEKRYDEIDLKKDGIYYEPVIRENDKYIISKCEKMNKINSFEITYDFGERKEVIKNQELLNLYSENEKKEIVPDINKVKNYIMGLANKYDTFKKDRTFQTTDKGIALVKGGIYGWSTNIDESAALLAEVLYKGSSEVIQPIYTLTAMSREINDIGSSYIEIDIARQHLWLYKEGNIVMDTDVVTGNIKKGNGTPTGTSKIWSREKNRELKGDNYSSHVDYWMPFDWSGCGLHDAPWRSSFGGDIYLTRGSHGCVNIPPGVMPRIFEESFVGMPVVLYDSNTDII